MARGGGKSAIGGDERRIERLGEREVDRVVGRDAGPQLPHARQQDVVRVAPDVQVNQVPEGVAAALVQEVPARA